MADTLLPSEDIHSLFTHLAPRYDLVNFLLTLGISNLWRQALIRQTLKTAPDEVLDLATGTGDVALLLIKKGLRVTAVDYCETMLEKARAKGVDHVICADIHSLPFEEHTFDAATISFGIRNLENRQKAFEEIYRVLKPQGTLNILEFSRPPRYLLPFYKFYLYFVMPRIAKLITPHGHSYLYLADSIMEFPHPKEFSEETLKAGFSDCSYRTLTCGIVTLYQVRK